MTNYFWVSTNPSYWKVDEIRKNKTEFFPATNDKGENRPDKKCFREAQPGDLVLFYESSPTSAIVARGKIKAEFNPYAIEQGITLEYLGDIGPLPFETINKQDLLRDMRPVKMRANGTLFEITHDEYVFICYMAQQNAVFGYSDIHWRILQKGFNDLFDIKAGSVVGRVMCKGQDIRIPVQIRPIKKDYTQSDFESDLNSLMGKLEQIIDMFKPKQFKITLIFEAGDQYEIPQKFRDRCNKQGIGVLLQGTYTLKIDGAVVQISLGSRIIVRVTPAPKGNQSGWPSGVVIGEIKRILEKLITKNPGIPLVIIFQLGGEPLPDSFIKFCINNGIKIVFEFDCGNLQGKIAMDVNDSKSNYSLILGHDVPIRIKATENYDQKKFEKDLRSLLKLIKLHPNKFEGTNLIFRDGGDLQIPEWFWGEIGALGLGIVIRKAPPAQFDQIWNNL